MEEESQPSQAPQREVTTKEYARAYRQMEHIAEAAGANFDSMLSQDDALDMLGKAEESIAVLTRGSGKYTEDDITQSFTNVQMTEDDELVMLKHNTLKTSSGMRGFIMSRSVPGESDPLYSFQYFDSGEAVATDNRDPDNAVKLELNKIEEPKDMSRFLNIFKDCAEDSLQTLDQPISTD